MQQKRLPSAIMGLVDGSVGQVCSQEEFQGSRGDTSGEAHHFVADFGVFGAVLKPSSVSMRSLECIAEVNYFTGNDRRVADPAFLMLGLTF